MESRLIELVKSANQSDILSDCPVQPEDCEIIFDHGPSHGLEVVSRGLFLVEVRNTGWGAIWDREQAMAYSEE